MIKAIVGANWGDEGKGKITDYLATKADIVIRFQGGNNAGHTIINEYGKSALHLLPSGIFNPKIQNVIGNGVALNIPALLEELETIKAKGVEKINLVVSDRAQIVMPYHILFDELEEQRLAKAQFGSTKSGMAPFYSDKYAKIGFQVHELFEEKWLEDKLERILPVKNALLEHLYHTTPLNKEDLLQTLHEYRDAIKPYVFDTVKLLREAVAQNKEILLEGQLGTLRDPDFGIYPYSTSSNTLSAYGMIGSGLAKGCDSVIAVTKAYSSCVGAGPFVSELFDQKAHELRIRGGDAGEFGAKTGRPRRVGTFDCVATRYGVQVQSATEVVMTNLDVLGYLDEIPVCVAYKYKDKIIHDFCNTQQLYDCTPVIETLPGWKCDIRNITDYHDLPKEAKDYVDFIEKQIGVTISMVSNGPKREQIMKRK